MICWVAEGASAAKLLDDVIVATDDDRIIAAVHARGFNVERTRPDHASGSDRVWEVGERNDADIIVNIQGDEPLITGAIIDACVRPLLEENDIDVVTLKAPIREAADLHNPNIVKLVCDVSGRALYFSRSIIPSVEGPDATPIAGLHYRHFGIYAYRRDALRRFCALPTAPLENQERLEQLRGLAAGLHFHVVESDYRSVEVNTPADLINAERLFRQRMEEQ